MGDPICGAETVPGGTSSPEEAPKALAAALDRFLCRRVEGPPAGSPHGPCSASIVRSAAPRECERSDDWCVTLAPWRMAVVGGA
jgi:hypothetical protein